MKRPHTDHGRHDSHVDGFFSSQAQRKERGLGVSWGLAGYSELDLTRQHFRARRVSFQNLARAVHCWLLHFAACTFSDFLVYCLRLWMVQFGALGDHGGS